MKFTLTYLYSIKIKIQNRTKLYLQIYLSCIVSTYSLSSYLLLYIENMKDVFINENSLNIKENILNNVDLVFTSLTPYDVDADLAHIETGNLNSIRKLAY